MTHKSRWHFVHCLPVKSGGYYKQHIRQGSVLLLELYAGKRRGRCLMLPGAVTDLTEAYISVIMSKCATSVMHCLKVSVVFCSFIYLFWLSVVPSALCMPPFGMCRPAWACGPHPVSAVRVGAGEKTPPLQRPFWNLWGFPCHLDPLPVCPR